MFMSALRYLKNLSRRLVVRVIMIALLSIVALGVSMLVGGLIPDWAVTYLGTQALDTILTTLATSMLAVTTFSLSVMTSAFQSAASLVTPRSRLVLREDTTTHSVLASFVGAFLFALIAIILRATPLMGERESVVLFVFTILVVAQVIVAIIRWINHLETLGSLDSTVGLIESKSRTAVENFAHSPALGCHIWTEADTPFARAMPCLHAPRDGYIQQLFEDLLQSAAKSVDATLYIPVRPGDYVSRGAPLVYIEGVETLGTAKRTAMIEAFVIAGTRSFDQDPRLGLTTLTEIASRALSPGINDPQTAIDVTHRIGSLLLRACPAEAPRDTAPRNDRLWLRPVALDTLYQLSLDVIARDAGDTAEVQDTVRKTLEMLAQNCGPAGQTAARDCASRTAQV